MALAPLPIRTHQWLTPLWQWLDALRTTVNAGAAQGGVLFDQALTGTKNGVNRVFTTAVGFATIEVLLGLHGGGLMRLMGPAAPVPDYTITGANQITFTIAPNADDVIAVNLGRA